MRLIDADALAAKFMGTPPDYYHTSQVVGEITAAPTIGGWISATDKQPDLEEQVLIAFEWTGRSGAKYKEIALDSFKAMRFLGYKPLFWMPLPEPPEEASGDESNGAT